MLSHVLKEKVDYVVTNLTDALDAGLSVLDRDLNIIWANKTLSGKSAMRYTNVSVRIPSIVRFFKHFLLVKSNAVRSRLLQRKAKEDMSKIFQFQSEVIRTTLPIYLNSR